MNLNLDSSDIDLLLYLVNDEIKALERRQSSYGTRENDIEVLDQLIGIRDTLKSTI